MIFLSFNNKGLASDSKFLFLKRLVKVEGPSVVFLQGTLRHGETIYEELELMLGG